MNVQGEYITNNLGLASYCALSGMKYLEARTCKGKNGQLKVMFVFEDSGGVGTELEKQFLNSREKKFRDFTFYFRNVIEESLRDVVKE